MTVEGWGLPARLPKRQLTERRLAGGVAGFHAVRNVPEAVVSLVDLLQRVDVLGLLSHLLMQQGKPVKGVFFHPIHGDHLGSGSL